MDTVAQERPRWRSRMPRCDDGTSGLERLATGRAKRGACARWTPTTNSEAGANAGTATASARSYP